jgi:undecaprenyl-diphosphatase
MRRQGRSPTNKVMNLQIALNLRRVIALFGGADLVVLFSMLVLLVGGWGFVTVAYKVSTGSTQDFDEWLLRALRNPGDPQDPFGPRWLEEMGRDLTALGGIAALTLVSTAVAGYLLISRKYRGLWLLVAATLGGMLIAGLLKEAFDRPRPTIVPHLSYVSSSSFPSGHSMLSAVVYLTLGTLLSRLVEQRRLKIYFLGIAILLTFLVGVSRIYMGVHYPTDVLAGWCAGLVWALLCASLARWLQQRGSIEGTAVQGT